MSALRLVYSSSSDRVRPPSRRNTVRVSKHLRDLAEIGFLARKDDDRRRSGPPGERDRPRRLLDQRHAAEVDLRRLEALFGVVVGVADAKRHGHAPVRIRLVVEVVDAEPALRPARSRRARWRSVRPRPPPSDIRGPPERASPRPRPPSGRRGLRRREGGISRHRDWTPGGKVGRRRFALNCGGGKPLLASMRPATRLDRAPPRIALFRTRDATGPDDESRSHCACLIAFGFAAPAQAWWSKGTLPACDSAERHRQRQAEVRLRRPAHSSTGASTSTR